MNRFFKPLQAAVLPIFAMFSIVATTGEAQAKVDKEVLKLNGAGIAVPSLKWADSEVAPRAVVLGLHGGVQHAGNFTELAEKLASKGIIFYAIDFRGHGVWLKESEKRPSVAYDSTARDLVPLVAQIRAKHPLLPVFCVGESLGAAMAIKATANNPKLFDGLILASCGAGPATKYHIAATFKSIGSGIKTLGRTVDIAPHITDMSDDERSNKQTLTDPLIRSKQSLKDLLVSVNFLHTSHKLAPKLDKDLPILVLQGEDDHIVQPESTKALFRKMGSKKKSIATFPKFGHLLVTNSYLKPEVIKTIGDWLTEQQKQIAPVATAAKRPDGT